MAGEIQHGCMLQVAKGSYFSKPLIRQTTVDMAGYGNAADILPVPVITGVLHGLNQKPSAVAATAAALPACTYANGAAGVGATLTGNANGALAAQDGITLTVNQYLLVKDQVAGLQNGLYKLTQVGDGVTPFILTRVTAMDTTLEFVGASVYIESGTVNAAKHFTCTNASAPTVGTTAITFSQSATGTVVPQGNVTTAGILFVQNLDPTNYVTIGPDIGGVMMPFGKLKAGEHGAIRLSPGLTIRAGANGGTVNLHYELFQD